MRHHQADEPDGSGTAVAAPASRVTANNRRAGANDVAAHGNGEFVTECDGVEPAADERHMAGPDGHERGDAPATASGWPSSAPASQYRMESNALGLRSRMA